MHPAPLEQELIIGILHRLTKEDKGDHLLTEKIAQKSAIQLQQSRVIVPKEFVILLEGKQPKIQIPLELIPPVKGLILQASAIDLGPQQTSHLRVLVQDRKVARRSRGGQRQRAGND